MLKIEILYPEIANLYAELANPDYISKSVGECRIIDTSLKDKPRFLDEEIDFVYMGTTTERGQLLMMDALEPYIDEIKAKMDSGQFMLLTGNAFEIFGQEIVDVDEMPYGDIHERVDVDSGKTRCFGLFDFTTYRNMMKRFNWFYVGEYSGIKVAGFKSTFTWAEYGEGIEPLLETIKGGGFDTRETTPEGFKYNNVLATYLIGPLLPLNPLFMEQIFRDNGLEITAACREAAVEAFDLRIEEYLEPNRHCTY